VTKTETWAAIDLRRGQVVSLRRGNPADSRVWSDDPLSVAQRWELEGANGLHIVDLDAALSVGSNSKTIESAIRRSKIPVEVGGGIRRLRDAEKWIQQGAARVVLGTLAFGEPSALAEIVDRLGPERVVIGADYRNGMIVTKGWTEEKPLSVLDAIGNLENEGIKTILATAVDADGMAHGPDLETLRKIRAISKIRILASGGVRNVGDVLELRRIGIDGVVLGRALYEGTLQLTELSLGA
jgi:phosphoribosylformimino-5-aminoimidazole carboxamide ribotide isomerase